MCGVIGILANENSIPRAMECLSRLEYRGYDSCGVGTLTSKGIEVRKAVGKIAELRQQLELLPLSGNIVLGHTRWATHGHVTEVNAHPHATDNIMIIHNGIIENSAQLTQEYGFVFKSQTDTEACLHLLELFKTQGYSNLDCVRMLKEKLLGSYALLIVFRDEEKIYALKNGSPLAVGYGNSEMYLGSDAIGLSYLTQDISYLEDGDYLELERQNVTIWNKNHEVSNRTIRKSNLHKNVTEKGDYDHFMRKEIYEQVHVLSEIIPHYLKETFIPRPNLINIIACGTSYHAGLVAKYWIQKMAKIPTSVDVASEFRYCPPPLCQGGVNIFISQSGETIDTLEALKCSKEINRIVGLVNVPESSIARLSDHIYPILAGPEIGVASTKTFTASLAILATFASSFDDNPIERHNLLLVPKLVEETLSLEQEIKELAEKIKDSRSVLFLGRGTSYPLALEGALKLKELSYIHAEGFASGEMKHGPIALIDSTVPIVALVPDDELYAKNISNIQEVIARGSKVILITNTDPPRDLNVFALLRLPNCHSFISPFIFSIPLQLLAYCVASLKGLDVDKPRNLAKSVVVE